jgi:hypothetical protein
MKEYENRAVDLAQNPAKLQALTNKLKEVRMTCPLFDTARWVSSLKHYSAIFFIMATFLNPNQSLNANYLRYVILKGLTTRCGISTAMVATLSRSR